MEAYKCLQCNKNLFNSLNMKYHLQICGRKKLFNCLKCGQHWDSEFSYKKHILICGRIICDICKLPFINSKAFEYHKMQKHTENDESVVLKIYCCHLCNFKCTYKGDL